MDNLFAFLTPSTNLSILELTKAQSVEPLHHSKFSSTKSCPHHGNFSVCLVLDKSWNICQDLYRSVQIRTELFLKLQLISMSILHFLITFFNFKTVFTTSYFSTNICGDLYKSVQIRRESSTWAVVLKTRWRLRLKKSVTKQQSTHCVKTSKLENFVFFESMKIFLFIAGLEPRYTQRNTFTFYEKSSYLQRQAAAYEKMEMNLYKLWQKLKRIERKQIPLLELRFRVS